MNLGAALRGAFAPPIPAEQRLLQEMPALRRPAEATTANIGAAIKSAAANGTGKLVDKIV